MFTLVKLIESGHYEFCTRSLAVIGVVDPSIFMFKRLR